MKCHLPRITLEQNRQRKLKICSEIKWSLRMIMVKILLYKINTFQRHFKIIRRRGSKQKDARQINSNFKRHTDIKHTLKNTRRHTTHHPLDTGITVRETQRHTQSQLHLEKKLKTESKRTRRESKQPSKKSKSPKRSLG